MASEWRESWAPPPRGHDAREHRSAIPAYTARQQNLAAGACMDTHRLAT